MKNLQNCPHKIQKMISRVERQDRDQVERERESASAFEMESAAALVSFSLNFNIKPSYAIANPSFPSHSSKITSLHRTLHRNCSYPSSSSSNTIFRSLSAPLSPISLRNPCGRTFVSGDGKTTSNSPSDALVLNVEVSIILGLLFVYSLFSLRPPLQRAIFR